MQTKSCVIAITTALLVLVGVVVGGIWFNANRD